MLGFAGTDNHGLEGLERSLDPVLAGHPGSETIVKDPLGRALDVVSTKPATPGKSVRLTIDDQVQANAQQVIESTVQRFGAKSATAIVSGPLLRRHPRDGRRALVSTPTASRRRVPIDTATERYPEAHDAWRERLPRELVVHHDGDPLFLAGSSQRGHVRFEGCVAPFVFGDFDVVEPDGGSVTGRVEADHDSATVPARGMNTDRWYQTSPT